MPNSSHSRKIAAAALTLVLTLGTVGCATEGVTPSSQSSTAAPSLPAVASTPATTTPSQDAASDADYQGLLLTGADLSDHEDTFVVRSSTPKPNGLPGASALFVNADDTRAVSDTIAIYPDAATATSTLRQALTESESVVVNGTSQPLPVGTDGTMICGTSPDGGKSVTLVYFTQGPALARLEFQSAVGDTTTDQFVTTVAKMQQIALRVAQQR